MPADAQYVRLELGVRITGLAVVQTGIDFWKDLTCPFTGYSINNVEAGSSDFIFENTNWQTLDFST